KENSFDMLNLVENDVELGTNGGTSHLASQEANCSGSLFWIVDSSNPSTTPIIEKIDKMEKLIIDRKVTLVDNEERPLKKVDDDSEDEESEHGPIWYPNAPPVALTMHLGCLIAHVSTLTAQVESGSETEGNHQDQVVAINEGQVVRIPLLDGKGVRVLGEKPKEKVRPLMYAKAKEKSQ
nr:hypothetical protein [Tanacetum cinerariifolium]